jgi:hypothetical protein
MIAQSDITAAAGVVSDGLFWQERVATTIITFTPQTTGIYGVRSTGTIIRATH